MRSIVTLDQFRQHLGLSTSARADDARLRAALESATALVETLSGRYFLPQRLILLHAAEHDHPDRVSLRADLLHLLALSDEAGDITLDNVLIGADGALRHVDGAIFWGAVEIEAVWCSHDDPVSAWRDSGDTLAVDCDALIKTLSVHDIAGADDLPRFQVGHLLRLNDEYLLIEAVDPVTQSLQVRRGACGTIPAAHSSGTVFECFQPRRSAALLCLLWADQLYRQAQGLGEGTPPHEQAALLGALTRPRVV